MWSMTRMFSADESEPYDSDAVNDSYVADDSDVVDYSESDAADYLDVADVVPDDSYAADDSDTVDNSDASDDLDSDALCPPGQPCSVPPARLAPSLRPASLPAIMVVSNSTACLALSP